MTRIRILLGVVGLAFIGYGVVRILQFPQISKPIALSEWLVAALIIHDGILVPVVTAVGFVVAKLVPSRARAYVQGGFIVASVVVLLALVLNHRHGHSAPGNALLTIDYVRSGVVLVVGVAVVCAALYVIEVLRHRGSTGEPPDRRDISQRPPTSSTDASTL